MGGAFVVVWRMRGWSWRGGRRGRRRRSPWRGGGFGAFGRGGWKLDQLSYCVAVRRFYSRPAPSLSPQPSQSHPSQQKTVAPHHDRSISCDSFLYDDAYAMRSRWCYCAPPWGPRKGGAGVEHGLRRGLEQGEERWGEWLERTDRSEWGRCKWS